MPTNITSTHIPQGVNDDDFYKTQQSTLCNVFPNNCANLVTGCCLNPLTNETSITSDDQNTVFSNTIDTNNLEDNKDSDLFASCRYFETDEINQTLSNVKSCQKNLFVYNAFQCSKFAKKLSQIVSLSPNS